MTATKLLAGISCLGLVVILWGLVVFFTADPIDKDSPEYRAKVEQYRQLNAQRKAAIQGDSAELLAQKYVRQAIDESVRHTANFPLLADYKCWKLEQSEGAGSWSGPRWFCTGTVEVTNAFNATLQHPYRVVLEVQGDDWKLVELTLAGRRIH